MSVVMEEFLVEDRREQAEKFAMKLLEEGSFSIAKIAQVSDLPEERVKELAEQREEAVFA